MTGHTLLAKIGHGETSFSIRCDMQEGSHCNTWCFEGCEERTEEHENHKMHPVDCMLIEWWNQDETSSVEGFTGPDDTEIHSGPIKVTSWGEDGIEWEYAE